MTEDLLVFPASFAQARLWFLDQLDPGNPAYNIAGGVRIEGKLDRSALEQAVLAIVRRHEVLRTTFVDVDGEPMQIVGDDAVVDARFAALQSGDPREREEELDRLAGEASREPFDLGVGPLLRTRLFAVSEEDHAFIVVMHHIVSDLWSVGVLFRELFALYEVFTSGGDGNTSLPELPIQYADYAHWQRGWFEEDEAKERQLAYWKEKLAGHLPRLELPGERRSLDPVSSAGARFELSLGVELTQSLERLGRARGKTLFMVLFSAFQALLYRYSGQSELAIGTAVAGRARPELAGLIGFFVNTLVLRDELDGSESFAEVLDRVSELALEAFSHQDLPFDKLVEELAPERNRSRTPLFRVMFAVQNAPLPQLSLSGLTLSEIAVDRRAAPFDLALFCRETGGSLRVIAEYATDCLEESAVGRLLEHYRRLLSQIARDPERALDAYDLLGEDERRELLVAAGGGAGAAAAAVAVADSGPSGRSPVHERFERRVDRRPDGAALVFEGHSLSYRELDERANRLAHLLRARGVGPESRVAVCLERSLDLVVALLATLKAGGAYVPLDPSYPEERLAFVLGDCQASVLVSDSRASAALKTTDDALDRVDVLLLDRDLDREALEAQPTSRPAAVSLDPDNLAYVIYTSGSTGRPKGVAVTHGNVARLFDATSAWFGFGEEDVWTLFHSYAFDFSVWELWGALAYGGRLVVVPHEVTRSPDAFVRLLAREGVTVLNQTPSAFRQLMESERAADLGVGLALRYVIFGGEALDLPSLRPWFDRHGDERPRLVNMYGITETTVHVTYRPVTRDDLRSAASVLGEPIPDLTVHLLDAAGNLVPVGAAGEIYVGGPGASRGYLERAALTAERFVPDPFSLVPGARLYKTGDRARRLDNGELEYLGRLDQQVKVRGFRIELGEIERCLDTHEAVEDCVVSLSIADDGARDPRLVAYVVPGRDAAQPVKRWLELHRRGGLEGKRTYELPDGTAILHQNRSETDFMYEEIFEHGTYSKHGVTISEGDTVFDVGANIGLFALFAARSAPDVRVYAFEPLPPLFEILSGNVTLMGGAARALNLGLSDRPRRESFRFYPHASVLSGRHADAAQEREVVKSFLLNETPSEPSADGASESGLDEVLEDRLESESYQCELTTISDSLRELGVERIHLLKIDVEKSECEVLDGIEDEDWPRIDQVIIEVHDIDGRLEEVEKRLARLGYRTVVEQDEALARTGLYNIYATRREISSAPSGEFSASTRPEFRSPARLVQSLRRHVSDRLPGHMVPSAFVLLDALPLTPQGKLDRRALPPPSEALEPALVETEAPRTPIEASVLSIYREVLGRDRVGPRDDFFELGGHSLLATQLIARARAAFQVEIPVRKLFESPTPEALARHVEEALASSHRSALPPIERTRRSHDDSLELSFAQRRLLFLHALAPDSSAYLASGAVRLRGPLDESALGRALEEIVSRHEVLRCGFELSSGTPHQRLSAVAAVALPLLDLSLLGRAERETELERRLAIESRRRFDLEKPPLLRALLLRLDAQEHVLAVTMHHIVSDGWSVGVLVRELSVLYSAFVSGRPSPLPELEVQYADYAAWQGACLEGGQLETELDYWREALADPPSPIALPTDHPRPAVQRFRGARRPVAFSASLTESLEALSRREGVTLFMTLLAAFETLLFRYSGQEDVVVGSPIANRKERQTERLIGCFVNTLVLRSDLSGDPSFSALLKRVRGVTLGAYANQDVPFEKLVEEQRPDRALSRHPLFQVVFSFENASAEALHLEGLEAETIPVQERDAKFDLVLTLMREENGLRGWLEYDADLFEAGTMIRMAEHLTVLLEAAASSPSRRLSELPLVGARERRLLLSRNVAGSRATGQDGSVLTDLRERTRERPEALALASKSLRLTYRELDERSSRIAERLLELGLNPEERVAVACRRSPLWAVAILGALKAGGAFVPLDPTLPAKRLSWMLEAASAKFLLTESALAGRVPLPMPLTVPEPELESVPRRPELTLMVDEAWVSDPGEGASRRTQRAVDPPGEQLAYVIFTSGSTGRPKGVAIPHRGLRSLASWHRRAHETTHEDRASHLAGLGFDAAVWELWPYLCAGASVHFPDEETHASPESLVGWLDREGITVSFMPTPLAETVMGLGVRTPSRLRRLLTGGDRLHRAPSAELGYVLFNHYGPTESSVVTTWCGVPPRADHQELDEAPPIGKAIDGTEVRVLGDTSELVPMGVEGELAIGGTGLARGYLDDPATTAERFVPDPFAATPGARLYRTGDRVRMLEDGTLHFLGRADDQIKLRGFRIELGEIETLLSEHPAVSAVAVALRRVRGEDRLVAYVVWRGEAQEEAVRRHLRERVSEAMVPSFVVPLGALPLTSNGKVDRRALPVPELETEGSSESRSEAPRDRIEEDIAAIWCESLRVETVGIDDNFFDVGGHSLLLVRVHRQLSERYPDADVSVVELFQNPTIRLLSRRVRGAEPAGIETKTHPTARGRVHAASDGFEPIAIVGTAGRFPKARTVDELWTNLEEGREGITFFSEEELRGVVEAALLRDPGYVRARGVIEDAELFDAGFFGYNAREAELLDPQHRVFLEVAWEGLERAGLANPRYLGRVGVFAGSSANTYVQNLLSRPELLASVGTYLTTIANDKDFLATRVSYKLDLRGPSITVQTACSTSLVAVHVACQSLRLDECDVALAGGVSVGAPRKRGYLYTRGGIQSSDGHCRAFDASASGTVAGEGAGVVVLKRLSDALAAGDRVEAVILGSSINNDGSLKVGYTAPSVDGQAEVLMRAQALAGVEPSSLGYVETHGTGTALGDPIEVAALKAAWAAPNNAMGASAPSSVGLGSVKSNLGHLDAAAGVASLIKTTLVLDREAIPASLHFESPNPELGLDDSPFYVNRKLRPWPRGEAGPRRAGVSSFGIGGTNAHVVLEEAPAAAVAPSAPSPRREQILVWSARSEEAADRLTSALEQHFASGAFDGRTPRVADAAFTLGTGRRRFAHRRCLVVEGDAGTAAPGTWTKRFKEGVERLVDATENRGLAFVFPGQGSQFVGMGRALYETEERFRAACDRGFDLLLDEHGLDVRPVLFPTDGGGERAAEALRETRVTQPLLFVVEHALASLLMSWGLTPEALVGHSLGEYVAASIAGVLDFEAGVTLTALRGRLMQSAPRGSMTSVALSEGALLARLPDGLSLAAVNGASLTVASGATELIDALERELAAEGVGFRRLETSHAFHSDSMDDIIGPFEDALREVRLAEPRIPFVSNVTGNWIEPSEAIDPAYWARHLRAPVRFAEGVARVVSGSRAVVEVGPGRALGGELRSLAPVVVPTLGGERDSATRTLATAMGRLWLSGVEIDWVRYFEGEGRRRLLLPTYPFERERYWVERSIASTSHTAARIESLDDWFHAPAWTRSPHRRELRERAGRDSVWLLLRDALGLGRAMASRLRALGYEVVEADADENAGLGEALELQIRADGAYVLDPLDESHYAKLLSDLLARGRPLTHVVQTFGLSPEDGSSPSSTRAERAAGAFTALARALVATPELERAALTLVTQGAQAVLPGEVALPERSAVLGAARVFPQEHPSFTCLSLDVAGSDGDGDGDGAIWDPDRVDALLGDAAAGGNAHVAHRGRGRWVESTIALEPEAPAAPDAVPSRAPSFRRGGTYLITGGLGNVGLAVAEHLAGSVDARLVLVSRRPLDERPGVSERIAKLSSRCDLLVERADVTDVEAMEAVFRRAEERFGRIDGVIHAAGATGAAAFRTLSELTPADLNEQFHAKARGVEVLGALLRDRDLDFCVLCSSLSVRLGGLGFSAYASANRFMSAFAELKASEGAPWLAIDWDGWDFREPASRASEPSELGATLAHLLMSPAEGVETLERAVRLSRALDAGAVIVSTGDLAARRKQWLEPSPSPKDETASQAGLERRARPALRSTFEAPATPLEGDIAAIWQELLGVEVGVEDDFFELGGHSLLATQIVSRLRMAHRVEVPLGRFLETPTVRRLAEVVRETARDPEAEPESKEAPSASAPDSAGSGVGRPLSFAQQRLWFFEQMTPGSATYNFSQPCRHHGALEPAHLREALRHLIVRHETLRTSFVDVGGEPRQIVHDSKTIEPAFLLVDLESVPEESRHAEAVRLARVETETPFDLSAAPLVRVTCVKLSPVEQVLFVTMHHIVTDGWSLRIFFEELAECYDAVVRGGTPRLPELPMQYADFAAWQRRWLAGDTLESRLGYWTERLRGAPDALELPADRRRPDVQTFHGARVSRMLPESLARPLLDLSQRSRATLFMTLLAVFEILLYRLSGQDDLVVGTPVAGRNRAETEGLLGFFINTLVLRTDLSGEPTFDELLGRVKRACLDAYDHQDVPFEKVVEAVAPERDLGRTPLFQVMFNLLNFESRERGSAGLVLEGLTSQRDGTEPWNPDVDSKFDLTLYASERPHGINLLLVYNADLFDRARMTELLAQYEQLAAAIVRDPSRSIVEHSLVTAEARERLPDPAARLEADDTRFGWRGGAAARIADRARSSPDRPALVDSTGSTDYRALVLESRKLARALSEHVEPGDVVAVLAARRRELAVALLAVWEAEASFVVLDPRYPPAALASRVAAARPRALLRLPGTPAPRAALAEALARVPVSIEVELGSDRIEPARDGGDAKTLLPDGRAYLAFTSGSTGAPKAVVGTHAPLDHFVAWQIERFGLGERDRFAMLSGLAYDPLLRDILTPLCAGAALVIPSDDTLTEGGLLDWLARESITVIHTTPSVVRMLVGLAEPLADAPLQALRYAFVGGEALTGDDVRGLRRLAPSVQCVNLYGTTETPQGVAFCAVTPREADRVSVPLGRGIDGVQLLVLGRAGAQSGVGELGEIHVRSPYLSAGYWEDEPLTESRFSASEAGDGSRIYRTGDRGRYLPDGSVAFHGRNDHQVKLRGHRIELGEIEAFLRKHPSAERSVVLCREGESGDGRLVAYIEGPQLAAPARAELERYLIEKLPDFMIPSFFVAVDAFPLTPNGKLDVASLPDPERPASEGFVEPRDATERVLAQLWAELLDLEQVSVRDDFFDLGGHSLLATQLISRVREVLEGSLSLRAIFESPTVEGMVRALAVDEVAREQLERRAELLLKLADMSDGDVAGVLDPTSTSVSGTSGAGGR